MTDQTWTTSLDGFAWSAPVHDDRDVYDSTGAEITDAYLMRTEHSDTMVLYVKIPTGIRLSAKSVITITTPGE